MIRLPFYLTVIELALGCASNSTTTTTTANPGGTEVVFARFRSVLPWNASETSAYEDAYESAITPKLNELGHVLNVESGNLHGNFALSYTIGNTNCDRVKAAMESIRNDADFIESHSVICG